MSTLILSALISAIIGAAFSTRSRADTLALAGVIVGLAFIGGIVLARLIGGRGNG